MPILFWPPQQCRISMWTDMQQRKLWLRCFLSSPYNSNSQIDLLFLISAVPYLSSNHQIIKRLCQLNIHCISHPQLLSSTHQSSVITVPPLHILHPGYAWHRSAHSKCLSVEVCSTGERSWMPALSSTNYNPWTHRWEQSTSSTLSFSPSLSPASSSRYLVFLKDSSFELVVNNIGFLQILAGILFLVLAGLNINDAKHHKSATILNNVSVAVIFVITVLNVIISTFGVQQNDINWWMYIVQQLWRKFSFVPYYEDSVTVSLFAFSLLIWQIVIRNKNQRTMTVKKAGLSNFME